MRPSVALGILATGVAISTSCSEAFPVGPPGHPLAPGELAIRRALGVPDDATQVLVLAQTSHLDIDWQQTFSDYYDSYVGNVFLQARQTLDSQPRAFYSVAEMAFLKQHVQAHPEELAPLQADAARGALRIVGGGMTSPDTLLPESEMLFRDLLYGVRFSEDTFGVTPTAAWVPDSFGHSGALPDVLAAAGYSSVGFSRIDGSPTIFQKVFHPEILPLPG
jgi:alpha-mannosidase